MQKKMRASRRAMGMNYAIREVTVPAAAAAARGMKMYNFNIGDPNKWDFETPEYFKETLRQAVDNTDNGYGDSQGNLNLRQAIVDREFEKNGVRIDVKDVYVTAGVSECINVMMGAMMIWFGWSVPAAVLLYYVTSAIWQVIQQQVVTKRVTEKAKAEAEAKLANQPAEINVVRKERKPRPKKKG